MALSLPIHPTIIPHTKRFTNVAVIFVDVCGFVKHTAVLSDQERVDLLHHIYLVFSIIAEQHDAQIIKYLGDGCLIVCGLSQDSALSDTAVINDAINLSIAMQQTLPYPTKSAITHGNLIGGYIGHSSIQFDIWGSIVDRCARILETTTSNAIHVCHNTIKHYSLPIRFSKQDLVLKDFGNTSVYQYRL